MTATLFALAAVSLAAADPAFFPFFEPVTPPRPLQVMAHRGVSSAAPENTRRALEMAVQDFYEWVEVDVRLTKDGVHVLFHDDALDGKSDAGGPVADRTAAELADVDAGSWFSRRFAGEKLLTLADALKLAKGRVNLYLDCKRVDPESLARDVSAAGMDRQVIVYDRPEVIARVRAASKGAVPVMTKWRPSMGEPAAFAKAHGLSAVEVDAADVSAEVVRAFHASGVKVQAKTLGDRDDRHEVWSRVADAGVDWVQTDRPLGVLITAFRKRHPDPWPVQVACHRGAGRYAPENTVPALALAAGLGADYIEIDVRTTKDGRFFLLHDGDLGRTTNARGPIGSAISADVSALDAGAWFGKPYAGTRVPTLAEGLDAIGPRAHVYLDAKAIAPEALALVMRERGLFDRSVVYQSLDYLKRLKAIEPTARGLPPLRKAADLEVVAASKPYGVDAAWSALSPELIAACHAEGIRVFSDALGAHETVDDYRRAIGWGLDVIQTDHPAKVLRAVELITGGGGRRDR